MVIASLVYYSFYDNVVIVNEVGLDKFETLI
jgi:hypothetical protein